MRTHRIEHNHIFQSPYPDSLLQDCPACASIKPLRMSKEYVERAVYFETESRGWL